jgi:hypothetical protein
MRHRKLYLNCLRVTAETYRLGTIRPLEIIGSREPRPA